MVDLVKNSKFKLKVVNDSQTVVGGSEIMKLSFTFYRDLPFGSSIFQLYKKNIYIP